MWYDTISSLRKMGVFSRSHRSIIFSLNFLHPYNNTDTYIQTEQR